ncbi:SIR2 family NAD-dependent protein deacylase [Caloranaerobacter sp. DY30410]|uniref:SIR2 family NAD-dependent protein deacylase n=1 Tax=Caloranaerobacter sp. DY30410 TaxID=3238305 RepID=UPI003D026FB7
MSKVVAFTGAGISKASGIPTFEELGDLRQKLSRSYFENYPIKFYEILKKFKDTVRIAKPNEAHIALAKYDIPVITMNIDSLHKKAGSKDVLEIHGNLEMVFCSKCNREYDFDVIYDSIYCKNCKSILNPNVVLYGDMIPNYFNAIDIIGSADILLVVGTSFYTSTASDLVYRAKSSGIKVEIINERAEELVPKFLEEIMRNERC